MGIPRWSRKPDASSPAAACRSWSPPTAACAGDCLPDLWLQDRIGSIGWSVGSGPAGRTYLCDNKCPVAPRSRAVWGVALTDRAVDPNERDLTGSQHNLMGTGAAVGGVDGVGT